MEYWNLAILVGALLLMTGADFRKDVPQPVVEVKKHCTGYTIIEAGLGVDCHGDTVKLVKKYGYYELASNYERPAFANATVTNQD